MVDNDVLGLTEALRAQQNLLQRLYRELDVEREASSSAASEALSMILRLQGEKAALQMEASQYKRMTEEKICHAEEALEIFDDLIYQKEMEIASLEFQVQAYQYRLLSMGGCNDNVVYEHKYFPDNFSMQKNEKIKSVFGSKRSSDHIPRIVEEEEIEELNLSERRSEIFGDGSIDTYWEQIKRLDERVKEISLGKDSTKRNKSKLWKGGTWSPSIFSQMRDDNSNGQTSGITITTESVELNHHDFWHETESIGDSASPSGVLDIYEVTVSSPKVRDHQPKGYTRLTKECKDKIIKPHFISDDERKINPTEKSSALSPTRINKDMTKSENHQLIQRIERLEKANDNEKPEKPEGEEELSLLKEIKEQLKLVQLEMRNWKAENAVVDDKPSLDLLSEAMIYFWF